MTDPRPRSDAEARDEARRILDDAHGSSPGLIESAMQRAGDHFAAREAPGDDRIEIWGRRIGRTLGAIFLVVLIVNLFTGWFF